MRFRPKPQTAALCGAHLVLLAAMTGCAADRAVAGRSAAAPEQLALGRGTLARSHLLTGELRAITAEAILVPRTPAWQVPIRWLQADGAQVVAGQRVLELDNSMFAGDLEQKRLQQARAVNELLQKEADLTVKLADLELAAERARIHFEKATIEADVPDELEARRSLQEKRLIRDKAEIELQKAKESLAAQRESAEAELEVLRIALRKIDAEVRVAETAIEALTLRAPRDGILVVAHNRREDRKFQMGDVVQVGNEVMSIPDLSAMKVEAQLSDVDDGRVEVGMTARCTLDTYPDEVLLGRVVEITPVAKEADRRSMRRAFRAVIHLEQSDPEKMRPGMSVQVEVARPSLENVVLVPRAALHFAGGAVTVQLVDGSLREIELADCNARQCAVADGLAEGDRVRVAG